MDPDSRQLSDRAERHLVWVCAGCDHCEPPDGSPRLPYPCDGPSMNGAWVVLAEDHDAEVARLRAALLKYGDDENECPRRADPLAECTCGWEALARSLNAREALNGGDDD